MNWNSLRERFSSPQDHAGAARFRLPSVVLEVQPEFVLAARLDARARRVRRMGTVDLPHGSVDPDPARPNVSNQAALSNAVRNVMQAAGDGSGMGLLLPDGAVRAAVLTFEAVPQDEKEFDELV